MSVEFITIADANVRMKKGRLNILLWTDDLPFYRLFIIRSSARRTKAVHVRPDVIEAELADLQTTR